MRERLDDANEDARRARRGGRALSARVCDASSVDRLTELARKLGVPGTTEDDQQIALGALVGLAAMQPPDLRARLAPLLKRRRRPGASRRRTGARRAWNVPLRRVDTVQLVAEMRHREGSSP